MRSLFSIQARYSLEPAPSSGIIAAIRDAQTCPVGSLRFQRDDELTDENPYFVALYDEQSGDLIALSSLSFYYHEGHLYDVNDSSPVYVDVDPVFIEQAHEFLVNSGQKPVWWRGHV